MERVALGFTVFVLTFVIGVCAVNPRLIFLEEEEFRCVALVVANPLNLAAKTFSR